MLFQNLNGKKLNVKMAKRKCIRKKTVMRKVCADFRTRGKGFGKCLRFKKTKIPVKVCAKYK